MYHQLKVKAITDAHVLVYAAIAVKDMQCCSVHWLCCSKLMTKKRKKTEETKTMMGSLKDCAAPAVRRNSCSDERY